eukprot:1125765-Amphidinium_carterae.1
MCVPAPKDKHGWTNVFPLPPSHPHLHLADASLQVRLLACDVPCSRTLLLTRVWTHSVANLAKPAAQMARNFLLISGTLRVFHYNSPSSPCSSACNASVSRRRMELREQTQTTKEQSLKRKCFKLEETARPNLSLDAVSRFSDNADAH